ncbi:SDR family NAD(P)-dependent oxidoreductase [Aquabacterium sp.]|uniref:SDR family NAD(P)-dependent oxidoreductase n=1 Tax=Aquabacterium sp. TaxID=1872578 RepID=UPI002BA2C27C|nr:glucose 1-dehydrogenase [Aquabacterium sp.]HSW06962.1 glucose 1-dehydrogenase [Aquabacterium sp.]
MPGLTGLVVAITGAGQGIGRGLAQAFAAQGARLVLSDIDGPAAEATAAALRAADAEAMALRVDVRNADEAAAQVATAVRHFGRLDVMLCNAGIMQLKPLLELDAADWDRMLGVNVTGSFLTLQAAARQMLSQSPLAEGRPRGKVIQIASIAGRPGAAAIASVIAPYRASKAAVISLTQSAAITLAPHITVNAICPGLVDTDMWRAMDRDWTALQGLPQGEAWRQRVAGVPMGRPQTPQDVAGLALFLASPAADYMTGQSINIDGGLMMS